MGTNQSTRQIGDKAEDLACEYLTNLGYKIVDRNYQIRGGEIDIVTKKDEILVFVEVKARYSHVYGTPQESITAWKLKALLRTAQFYIQKINWGNKPYRLDLLAIDFTHSFKDPEIELIQNITF